jgi:hypothetical protein
MLEWLRAGGDVPRSTLELSEFHQGYGPQKSISGVVRRFLTGHPVGRAILQLVAASLLLLLAVAPRAIRPRPRERVERRDPLEQVDALALAYQSAGATRTATSRLLHGLRWRVERAGAAGRARPDDTFLAGVASAEPARRDDVALVRRALETASDTKDLPEIGRALRRIEDTLTTNRA